MSQITTHILDIARGLPAANIPITLYRQHGENWDQVAAGVTNNDGRIANFCPFGAVLAAGTYCMHFATAEYFNANGQSIFYPWADVVFAIGGDGTHYHIPLLLSPFGYSTYRGS